MNPVHPCRLMPTRHCPQSYGAPCGERLCARFGSDDETPWRADDARLWDKLVTDYYERVEQSVTTQRMPAWLVHPDEHP